MYTQALLFLLFDNTDLLKMVISRSFVQGENTSPRHAALVQHVALWNP